MRGAGEESDQTQENLAIVVYVLVRTAAAVSERQTIVVIDEQVRSVHIVTHICMIHEERNFWINRFSKYSFVISLYLAKINMYLSFFNRL